MIPALCPITRQMTVAPIQMELNVVSIQPSILILPIVDGEPKDAISTTDGYIQLRNNI